MPKEVDAEKVRQLAQVGHEAFLKVRFGFNVVDSFESLPDNVLTAWEAAVLAIVEAYEDFSDSKERRHQ